MPITNYELGMQYLSNNWNAIQYHHFFFLAGHSVKETGLENILTFLSEEYWSGTPME